MKEIVPDYRLDMVGEPCPYPAVVTLEALPQLQKGKFGSGERLPAVHQQHSSDAKTTVTPYWIFSRMAQPFAILSRSKSP